MKGEKSWVVLVRQVEIEIRGLRPLTNHFSLLTFHFLSVPSRREKMLQLPRPSDYGNSDIPLWPFSTSAR